MRIQTLLVLAVLADLLTLAPAAYSAGTLDPPESDTNASNADPQQSSEADAAPSENQTATPAAFDATSPSTASEATLSGGSSATTTSGEALLPSDGAGVRGHLLGAVGASLRLPRGRLGSSAVMRDYLAEGIQLDGDISFGVSSHLALGALGYWSGYTGSSSCAECEASVFGLIPLVRYHLVRGTRFDPWLSAGAGYRRLRLHTERGDDVMSGVDLVDLRVGGDWYAASAVGFGPFLELNAGTMLDRPTWVGKRDTYWSMAIGFRAVLQGPGRD